MGAARLQRCGGRKPVRPGVAGKAFRQCISRDVCGGARSKGLPSIPQVLLAFCSHSVSALLLSSRHSIQLTRHDLPIAFLREDINDC